MTFLPGLYDIHAHLADARLSECITRIQTDCQEQMQGVLVNAARVSEWPEVTRLAAQEKLYGALGCHPFFVADWQENSPAELRRAITAAPAASKIIAIGEIGLDFWEGRGAAAKQQTAFSEQLLLAQSLSLPVILHNRKAWPDFFALLKDLRITRLHGVCHHFNASREIARQALERGLFLSFCGPLTYPNAHNLHDLARYVPLEQLLVETDCPDLPPQSKRGGLSLPTDVEEIIVFLAQLRGITTDKITAQLAKNWQRLFPNY